MLSLIDFPILAFLAIFAYSGFHSGITEKLFSITGMMVALVLAVKFMGAGAQFLAFVTGIRGGGIRGSAAHVVSFLMIFAIVIVATKITYFMLTREKRNLPMSQRVLGSMAGFIEGGVILSVLLIWLNVANFPSEYQKQRSILYKPALHFAPRLFDGIALGLPGSKGFYNDLSEHLDVERLFKR